MTINAIGISKRFGDFVALDDAELERGVDEVRKLRA